MKMIITCLFMGLFSSYVLAESTSNPVLQQTETMLQQKQTEYRSQIEGIRQGNPLYVYAEENVVHAEDQYQSLDGFRAEFREELKKATEGDSSATATAQRMKVLIAQVAFSEVLEDEKAREAYKDILGRVDPYKRADFLEMILADTLRLPFPEELNTTDFEKQWDVLIRTKQDRKQRYRSEIEACRTELDIPKTSIKLAVKESVATYLWRWVYEPYISANTPQETHELRSEIKKLIHEISRLEFEEQKPEGTPKKAELSADVKKQIAEINLKIETLKERKADLSKREAAACLEIYKADPELNMIYEKKELVREERKKLDLAREKYDGYLKENKIPDGINHEYGQLVQSVVLADLYNDAEIKKYQTYLFQTSPSVESMKRGMEKMLRSSLLTFSKDRDRIITKYFKRTVSVQKTNQKRMRKIEAQYEMPESVSNYRYGISRSVALTKVYTGYLSRHSNQEIKDMRNEAHGCRLELNKLKYELGCIEPSR